MPTVSSKTFLSGKSAEVVAPPTQAPTSAKPSPSYLSQVAEQAGGGLNQIKTGLQGLFTQPEINAQDVAGTTKELGPLAGAANLGAQVLRAGEAGVANLGKVVGGIAQTATAPLAPVFNVGTEMGKKIGENVPLPIAQGLENTLRKNPSIGDNAQRVLDMSNLAIPDTTVAGTKAINGKLNLRDVPIADFTSAIKTIKESLPSGNNLKSKLTNTDVSVFNRISESPEHAQRVKDYLATLDEGKNPNVEIAYTAAQKIKEAEANAQKQFKDSAVSFTQKGTKFDVASRVNDVATAVKDFSPGYDIRFEQTRDGGKLGNFKLIKGQYSPFNATEVGYINQMFDIIHGAKSLTADEVLALDKKLGTFYNAVKVPETGPTPYHALVMKIKQSTEQKITDLLPPDMREAYKKYALVNDMQSEIGNKIVDSSGSIKDSAPSFIGNLYGKNKGVTQDKVNKYKDVLGMDLSSEAQAAADAQKLKLTEAPSGGRLSDILKASIFSGGGAAIGAVLPIPGGSIGGAIAGAEAGRRLTSPRRVGNAAIEQSINNFSPEVQRILRTGTQ